MMRFGHMGDAFDALRTIDESGGDLREWAVAVAELLGEQANLFWPAEEEEHGRGMTEFTNLGELLEAMKAKDPRTLDQHGQWRTDLPTFGVDMDNLSKGTPRHTDRVTVWSWDQTLMIVGTCGDDLRILPRADKIRE